MVSKYRAQKAIIDGIAFDSRKEARRYQTLKMLEHTGQIRELKLQVPFELQPAFRYRGKQIRAIKYIADFVYKMTDKSGQEILVVEDAKGYKTDVYELKRKMFLFTQGFEITEV